MATPTEEQVMALAARLTPELLGSLIDHTLLSPTASHDEVRLLCDQALSFGAASVCVHTDDVLFARRQLAGTRVKVCTVVGFPLGADTSRIKAAAADEAFTNGADEADMVIDIASALERDYDGVREDIREVLIVRDAFNRRYGLKNSDRRIVKVIIETCYLISKDIIQAVCRIAKEEGADFVKSSTGFGQPKEAGIPRGATPEFITWMREAVGPYDAAENPIGVKASGGITTARQAIQMLLAAGILDEKGIIVKEPSRAVRLGTSSGHLIVQEFASAYGRAQPAAE